MDFGLTDFLSYLGSLSDMELIMLMVTYLGPPVLIGLGLPMWFFARLHHKKHEYVMHETKYILLAVDVPKETEQSPKAVESVFTSLAGALKNPNKYEKYWLGVNQPPFSLEITSLGGYIQFFIRTPLGNRDLVEAAIYAQYPDAEIVESEDYVDRISSDFDTEEFDVWGTEFVLDKKNCYPIRTYEYFEHAASEDFKDPMAALLEILSRIKTDEDVWLQLLVIPTNDAWKEQAQREVKKIIESSGGGHKSKPSWFSNFSYGIVETLRVMADSLIPYGEQEEGESSTSKDSMPSIMKLTPGQRSVIEAIERKASKIGFHVKFRMVYWGRRETFLKGRGVEAVKGAIKQFTSLELNGFKPYKLVTTSIDYFLKKRRITKRQRSILRAYKSRSPFKGAGHGFILNTEELATVYHFPVMTVKAPLVHKTETKKGEPPFALPVFTGNVPHRPWPPDSGPPVGGGQVPPNLPIVE